MAQEIEVKFKIDDPQPLRVRLRELGAFRVAHVLETNRIFDYPDRRLLAADCGLRVREARRLDGEGEVSATITFKGPREPGNVKVREELESATDGAAVLAAILARLGLQEVVVYEKRRETWRLSAASMGPSRPDAAAPAACQVCLDELPQLGWYVEIEGPDRVAVEAACRQLSLVDRSPVGETYVELAATHGEADQTGQRRLTFNAQ